MTTQGYQDHTWAQAKEEAKTILAGVARRRGVIAYSDLTAQLRAMSLLAWDQRFFLLLREILEVERLFTIHWRVA